MAFLLNYFISLPIAAIVNKETMRSLLFRQCDVRCFFFLHLFFSSAVLIASLNVFNLRGINFFIASSLTVALCFRLSISRLANEAFTATFNQLF